MYNKYSPTKTRFTMVPANFGGKACGSAEESKNCNSFSCPIDCVVGDWLGWGSCSKTCGYGLRTNTRTITTPAAHGGVACPATTLSSGCSTEPCVTACELSEWSAFGTCDQSCGTGSKTKTRSIVTLPTNSGTACGSTELTAECMKFACPVDCALSGYSAFTSCTFTCGTIGEREKSRSVISAASNGGVACAVLKVVEDCNRFNCPVDAQMSQWSAYSPCTRTCGTGSK